MAYGDNEINNRNRTLVNRIQSWVAAHFLPITRIVYYSKGAASRNTVPATNGAGKLDYTFLTHTEYWTTGDGSIMTDEAGDPFAWEEIT